MSADSEAFGYRLRECRLAAGLSQRALAERSGLSVRMISNLEQGRTRWPYRDSLIRLADALSLDGPPRAAFLASADRRLAGAASHASRRPGRAGRPRQLPAAVPGFAGRADQLDALSRILEQPGGTATICAIGGMAGVGKTALAVQWAHQVAAEFPDGQLYVNLRGYDPSGTPVPPTEAVRGFLDALGVPAAQVSAIAEAQLSLYRSLLAGRRMLVILDNARDVAQARPLLPGSLTCRVVVTSRDQLAGLAAIEAARPLVLDVLTEHEARQLLASRLGEARLASDPDAVARIISACGHLPLALSIVAARAATQPRLPLSRVAADVARPAGATADVRAAFSWSYRQLGSATARVFRLAGLHPGPVLEPGAVAALTGMTAGQAVRELEALARVGLIQPIRLGRYGLHDLLRGYAAELAGSCDSADDRRAALTGLLDYYLTAAALAMDAAFPAERHRRPAVIRPSEHATEFASGAAALTWLSEQRANLVAAIVHAAGQGWPDHATKLAQVLARFLEMDAQFADSISVFGSVGRAARGIGDQKAEAVALLSLGSTYLHQGRYREGIDCYRRAHELGRETGQETEQARALVGLGVGNLLLGHFKPAVAHLEQSLTLYRKLGDPMGEARVLANLAFADLRQGRYAEATPRLRESLALCRDIGDRRGQGVALANLGEIELRQDRLGQAASDLREALEAFRQVGDRVSEADTVANLGLCELRQGRPAEAIEHLNQALDICRQAGDVPRQALALNGLGDVLLAMERPAQARRHFDAALKLAIQADEKYEQARAHDGLGDSYQASAARSQARRHWGDALARYTELGAPEAAPVRAKLSS